MPAQKPGKSKQDYRTPPAFLDAVEDRFGDLTWDCAATAENSVVDGGRYFAAEAGIDALTVDWRHYFKRDAVLPPLLWLNPPFGTIAHLWAPLVSRWTTELPWLRLLFFTPAALGSEWYRKHVEDKAMVLPLNPRMTFVGESDPYPKDLMLSCFGFGVAGVRQWRWMPSAEEARAARKLAKAATPKQLLRASP
jgi:hypothetical protein